MIDPQDLDLPRDEMSLAPRAPTPPSPSWQDLWTYEKEIHATFHTIPDNRAALCLFTLGHSKLANILNGWSKN